MEIVRNNKGLIMFYLFMSVIMMVWVFKVDKENDKLMQQKSAYVLNTSNN